MSNAIAVEVIATRIQELRDKKVMKELSIKIEALEKKYAEHDGTIKAIFEAIKQLLEPPPAKEKKIIGFRAYDDKKD